MISLRSLTSALLAAALLALAGCGGGGQETAPEVAQAPPARIEIAPSTVLLTAPGARKSLSARVFDAAGNALTTPVEWTSSRPAQVTVDAAGVVTAAGTGGSSQVTARIGTLASPPLLVVHTTVPAGTVLVNDANISGDPVETNPDAPPGVGNTYVVRLVDVAAPKVGDLLMNTEGKVVAGRVISVVTVNGVHTVTLGLPPAREMFPNLAIDEVIDLNKAEIAFPAEVQDRFDIKREGNTFTFTPKPGKFDLASAAPGSRSQAQASGRERPLAVLATRSLGPFECNGVVDGAAGAGSLPLAITVPPAFTIAVNPRLDVVSTPANGLERVVLRTEPTFSADWGLKALFAFEGKITCEAKLFEIKIPIGGPLALIIGGQFPVGVGVEVGGKLTALSMGITWKASAKTTVDVGLACPGGTNCELVKTFGPLETSVVPTYDVPLLTDLRLEPSVSTYAFVEAAIGNPFLKSLRFKAFKAKAGAALKGNFASQAIQVADPLYSSDYKLVSELKAGADTGFIGFAGFLGLNAIAETVLEVSADLGNSPTGTVTADVAEFNLDDTVNFTVKLDPRKADFIPLIGPYNVERIVLVRRDASLNATEVASVAATPGQTEFNIPFKSTSLATGRTNEFFAFVVTKLLPTVLPPLEIGQATAPAVTPENVRATVQFPTQLTGPTTLTVTTESQTTGGGSVPVANAEISLVNFSGGTTCATVDRVSSPTNASGIATFTVSPTARCLELFFFVETRVGGTVVAFQQMTPAVVFPVFEGDLEVVFAKAISLAAHLQEITGSLVIKSVPPGTESFTSVSLPNLTRVGGRVEVSNAVSVQLPVLESVGVGGLIVSSDALRGGLLLSSFEAPALRQTPSIDIRDNPALRTLAIGPVRVDRNFNIFRNGFSSFDRFSSGIVVGRLLQIAFNTGFNNQTANDFVSRVTFLEGGRGVVEQNTGP